MLAAAKRPASVSHWTTVLLRPCRQAPGAASRGSQEFYCLFRGLLPTLSPWCCWSDRCAAPLSAHRLGKKAASSILRPSNGIRCPTPHCLTNTKMSADADQRASLFPYRPYVSQPPRALWRGVKESL